MEVHQMENILKFYLLSIKLKKQLYFSNGYNEKKESVAEHIFGAGILALGLQSQINYDVNIDHVLSLLVISRLDEVIPLADRYGGVNVILGDMRNRYELLELYKEFVTMNTEEAVFAHMCDNIEAQITNEKDSDIIKSKIDEINFFYFYSHLDTNHKNLDSLVHFYQLCSQLKGKIRSGWDSTHWNVKSDRVESVAEHTYGTCVLALAMDSEHDFHINVERVIKILMLHEIGKVLIGDITPFEGITPEIKASIEHQAVKTVLGDLIYNDVYYNLFKEFDELQSNDGVFAHYCDKLEADLQSKVYQDTGCHHSLDNQSYNVVFNNPKAKKMIANGASTAFDIWYEWDRDMYNEVEESKPFGKVLDYVRYKNTNI